MCKKKGCTYSECKASAGIHDGPTFGSGELDSNGYWEFPCYKCARSFEAANPGVEAWPFEKKEIQELLLGVRLLLLQTDVPHVNQEEILDVLGQIELLIKKENDNGL